jgi:hypothetical protein
VRNLNVIVLTGGLTRDPELRHTPGGTPVTTLRLGYTTQRKIAGAWQDLQLHRRRGLGRPGGERRPAPRQSVGFLVRNARSKRVYGDPCKVTNKCSHSEQAKDARSGAATEGA